MVLVLVDSRLADFLVIASGVQLRGTFAACGHHGCEGILEIFERRAWKYESNEGRRAIKRLLNACLGESVSWGVVHSGNEGHRRFTWLTLIHHVVTISLCSLGFNRCQSNIEILFLLWCIE
jgi:hypothetical protein